MRWFASKRVSKRAWRRRHVRIAHEERPRYISTGAFLRVHISARYMRAQVPRGFVVPCFVLPGFVNNLEPKGRERRA